MSIQIGDGRSLPLEDGSVQEVFMGDVLVSPGFNIQTISKLLSEAKRVLDPETGVLVIGEEDWLGDFSTERFLLLDILLARAGFERCAVPPFGNANEMMDIFVWPREEVEKMQAQFILAKPIIESPAPASSRRRLFGGR